MNWVQINIRVNKDLGPKIFQVLLTTTSFSSVLSSEDLLISNTIFLCTKKLICSKLTDILACFSRLIYTFSFLGVTVHSTPLFSLGV